MPPGGEDARSKSKGGGFNVHYQGDANMGDKGSRDKAKKEKQKKAAHSPKEKRRLKNEKKNKQ
jgi:hypothetical protein